MRIHLVILAAFWAVFLLAGPASADPITGFFAAVKAVGLASAIASTAWAAGLLKIGISVALSALSSAFLGKPRSSGIQTETTQEKKQHEAACIAGTVTGAVLGAALGGFFGNGVGKTVMQVALGGGGAYLTHKHSCKKNS